MASQGDLGVFAVLVQPLSTGSRARWPSFLLFQEALLQCSGTEYGRRRLDRSLMASASYSVCFWAHLVRVSLPLRRPVLSKPGLGMEPPLRQRQGQGEGKTKTVKQNRESEESRVQTSGRRRIGNEEGAGPDRTSLGGREAGPIGGDCVTTSRGWGEHEPCGSSLMGPSAEQMVLLGEGRQAVVPLTGTCGDSWALWPGRDLAPSAPPLAESRQLSKEA